MAPQHPCAQGASGLSDTVTILLHDFNELTICSPKDIASDNSCWPILHYFLHIMITFNLILSIALLYSGVDDKGLG